MKVQKITSQPEFQPLTLQITIDSQEELDTIKTLTESNKSVTRLLVYKGVIKTTVVRDICSVFLGSIYQELNK